MIQIGNRYKAAGIGAMRDVERMNAIPGGDMIST